MARPEGFRSKSCISYVTGLGRSLGYCHSAGSAQSAAFGAETRSVHNG